ncbi:hypothetical protein [Mycobacterium asiaticum]|uniref:hypothetical protein n=1 Tax=Mycobacterium asiaticum TaxID=1790 RepID=UPI0012DB01F2|nr:hypothetical protein [Mycobacterium asiaticum]
MTALSDVRRRQSATLVSARSLLLHARAQRGPDGRLTPDEYREFADYMARLRELDAEADRLTDAALAEFLDSEVSR